MCLNAVRKEPEERQRLIVWWRKGETVEMMAAVRRRWDHVDRCRD